MKRLLLCLVCLLTTLSAACVPAPSAAALSTPAGAAHVRVLLRSNDEEAPAPYRKIPSSAPAEETLPEPDEAELDTAAARADGVGVVGRTFARGEALRVTAQENGFYAVDAEDGTWLVESWLVRMDGEKAPKAYTGYARNGAEVFASPYLEGEPMEILSKNAKLKVEDAFGTILRVTLADGREGYVRAASVSKSRSSSGGSGGGSSGGQDGGDIHLSARPRGDQGVVRLSVGRETPAAATVGRGAKAKTFAPGPGTILADGVEGYLAVCAVEDALQVLERGDERCTVLVGEQTGTVAADLLRFHEEPLYEAWDGFAKNKAPLYRQYRLLDEPTLLKKNASVHVIGELRDMYVVMVDARTGFLPKDRVSRTKITGGSSGGSDGDWTAPVL